MKRLFIHTNPRQPAGSPRGSTNNQTKETSMKKKTQLIAVGEGRFEAVPAWYARLHHRDRKPVDLGFEVRSTLQPCNTRERSDCHRTDDGSKLGFTPRSTLLPSNDRR